MVKDGVGEGVGVGDAPDEVDSPPLQPKNANVPIAMSSHAVNDLLRIMGFPRGRYCCSLMV
jgi:hypothetical protein